MNKEEQHAIAADAELMHRARRNAEEEARTTVRLRIVSGSSSIESVTLFCSSTRSRVVVDLEHDEQLEREIAEYIAGHERQAREKNYEGEVALDPIIKRVRDWRVSVTTGGGEIARVKHQDLWAGGGDTPNRAIWFFEHIPAGTVCTVSLSDDDSQFFLGRFSS